MIIEVDIYSAIRTRYSDGESIRSIAVFVNRKIGQKAIEF